MVGERAMELDENDDAMPGNIPHFSGDPDTELDLPPEYCHYRDEGCDLAESCLNCPFARCVYDEPGGKQRLLKRLRNREMARLYTAERKRVKELSQMFGVSQRTVQRALKTALAKSTERG
ncbi:helix-turn-helix domain-containing protein [Chloroflexota bacterium]